LLQVAVSGGGSGRKNAEGQSGGAGPEAHAVSAGGAHKQANKKDQKLEKREEGRGDDHVTQNAPERQKQSHMQRESMLTTSAALKPKASKLKAKE